MEGSGQDAVSGFMRCAFLLGFFGFLAPFSVQVREAPFSIREKCFKLFWDIEKYREMTKKM
jgi:hypothetical protein